VGEFNTRMHKETSAPPSHHRKQILSDQAT